MNNWLEQLLKQLSGMVYGTSEQINAQFPPPQNRPVSPYSPSGLPPAWIQSLQFGTRSFPGGVDKLTERDMLFQHNQDYWDRVLQETKK